MESVIRKLCQLYGELNFTPGDVFCWSPESREICYKANARGRTAIWSLLHETGHALLGHNNYSQDFELLSMELAAWNKAKQLAAELGIEVDDNHVEDCLDTYRDWLDKRSLCPKCGNKSFQNDPSHYRCYNCSTVWKVTPSRFCRTYRLSKQKEPSAMFDIAESSF